MDQLSTARWPSYEGMILVRSGDAGALLNDHTQAMHIVEALEAGVLSDSPDATVHAVHMTLHGPEALCGAGPIVGRVLKRFGDADRHTCLACFAAALPEARSAP